MWRRSSARRAWPIARRSPPAPRWTTPTASRTAASGSSPGCGCASSRRRRTKPGWSFENRTVGGVVPAGFASAVEKALRLALQEGGLAGYPVIGLRAALLDGAFHARDSSAGDFEIAAREAFKEGFVQAAPVLLEPVMRVEITTPGECLGGIIGDLQARRGSVLGLDMRGEAGGGPCGRGERSAGEHVRLCERAAVALAGPGAVHHAVRAVCAGSEAGVCADRGRRVLTLARRASVLERAGARRLPPHSSGEGCEQHKLNEARFHLLTAG